MYGSMPMKSKKKNSIYFACEVPTDGEYYVAVHQPSSRHFKDKY